MAMMTIGELLRMKDFREVWCVPPQASVLEALKVMADKDIGAVLVMDNYELVGIFSERDYARDVLLNGNSILEMPVRLMMTSEIVTATLNHTVEDCMSLMTNHRIRHLPIVDSGRIVGLVSIGDIVKAIITGQAKMISILENYIIGNDYMAV